MATFQVPTVSEWNLRFACSEEDVTAAWAFFGKQQPKSVTVADSVLSADVEGHSVKISVGDKGAVLKTSCSCYRTDNPPSWCAHVGAVFLWCSHHPNDTVSHEDVENVLDQLEKVGKLRETLRQMLTLDSSFVVQLRRGLQRGEVNLSQRLLSEQAPAPTSIIPVDSLEYQLSQAPRLCAEGKFIEAAQLLLSFAPQLESKSITSKLTKKLLEVYLFISCPYLENTIPSELRQEAVALILKLQLPASVTMLSSIWTNELVSDISVPSLMNTIMVDVLSSIGQFEKAIQLCEKYTLKQHHCAILIRLQRFEDLFSVVEAKLTLSDLTQVANKLLAVDKILAFSVGLKIVMQENRTMKETAAMWLLRTTVAEPKKSQNTSATRSAVPSLVSMSGRIVAENLISQPLFDIYEVLNSCPSDVQREIQLDLIIEAITISSAGSTLGASARSAVEALVARNDLHHAFELMVVACHVIGSSYFMTAIQRAFQHDTAFACRISRQILRRASYTKKLTLDSSLRDAISFFRGMFQPKLAYDFSMKALQEASKLEPLDISDMIQSAIELGVLPETVDAIVEGYIEAQRDVATLLWKAARTIHPTNRLDQVWRVLDLLLSKHCVYTDASDPDWSWFASFVIANNQVERVRGLLVERVHRWDRRSSPIALAYKLDQAGLPQLFTAMMSTYGAMIGQEAADHSAASLSGIVRFTSQQQFIKHIIQTNGPRLQQALDRVLEDKTASIEPEFRFDICAALFMLFPSFPRYDQLQTSGSSILLSANALSARTSALIDGLDKATTFFTAICLHRGELRIALTEVMTVTQYTKSADLNSVIEKLQLIVNYLATHPEHQPDLAALLRKKLRAIVWRQPGSSSSPVPPDEATSDIIAICAGWLPRGNVLSAVHNALSAFRSVAYKCNSEAMTFEELKTIVDNATAIYRRYGKIKTFTPLVQRLGISLQKTSFGTQINPIIASIVSMKDTDGDDEAMQSEDESTTSRIVFSSLKLNQIRHFD